MSVIRNVCCYCGSASGADPAFVAAACQLGNALADNDIGLVYGGGSVGLMGALAESVLARHGRVTGIIPEFLLRKERAKRDAQDIVVTRDMHERKRLMFERADAFIALPGGIGTLEELVEQLTWAQLGQHRKPILLVNIAQFWDPLLALLDHMYRQEFIRSEPAVPLLVCDAVEEVVPRLEQAVALGRPETRPEAAVAIERM